MNVSVTVNKRKDTSDAGTQQRPYGSETIDIGLGIVKIRLDATSDVSANA